MNEKYGAIAEALVRRALQQPGCFGVESTESPDGFAVTVAYFIEYSHCDVRIARIERDTRAPKAGERFHVASVDEARTK